MSTGPQGASATATRRVHVSTACEACKARKKKCSGQIPCQRCTDQNIECLLEQSEDGRRGRKRHLEGLSAKADALDTLLSSIRAADDESLLELLDLTRAQRPVEELVEAAKTVLAQHQLRNKSRARLRQAVVTIASLTDDPFIRVPAYPWTKITNSDEAVSHLVSVYFTWHHCAYPAIDQDLFVRGMESQELSSQFCSPLLVNAVLSVACMYTDHPSAFRIAEDQSTRGLHFLEEAERLWKLEEGRTSLTNLQALPSIISAAVISGKDGVSASYTYQSIAHSTELIKQVKKASKQGMHSHKSREYQRSYSLAVWGTFTVNVEVAIAWMKPLNLWPLTNLSPFDEHDILQSSKWGPYPNPLPAVKFFPFAIHDRRFGLYEIAADLLPIVLSGRPDDSPLPGHLIFDPIARLNALADIEQRMLKWYRHLPAEAAVDLPSDVVNEAKPSLPAWPAVGPLVDLHLCLRAVARTDPAFAAATHKKIRASRSIADLFKWVQDSIGLKYFGVYYAQAAALCILNLIDCLSEPGVAETFHTMIVVLSNVGRRWTIGRGILKMAWITVQERKLEPLLGVETLSLFELNAVDNWSIEDYRLFDMCSYPNYADISTKGRDFVELGELLRQHAATELASDPSGGKTAE